MSRRATVAGASPSRPRPILLLALLPCAMFVGCHETDPVDACMGVDCSGHGRCLFDRVHATCLCDTGFVADGLACVPDVPGGQWESIDVGAFVDIVLLGSAETEAGRGDDEARHEIVMTRDFIMATTEVTQAAFLARMGHNPSVRQRCGLECPVENVTWHEAAAYCNLLSDEQTLARCYDCEEDGDGVITCEADSRYAAAVQCPGYRLPTEAEWEYAARAGTESATWRGDLDDSHLECEQPNEVLDPIAWFCGNAFYAPRHVGETEASPEGLYDMLGNVAEWCHDWYGAYPDVTPADYGGPGRGSDRVHRGGSHEDDAARLRAAARGSLAPAERLGTIGFRPVRTAEQ